MTRMISTHLIANHRLTTAWLNRVERAGIAAVEIFCAPQHSITAIRPRSPNSATGFAIPS